LIEYKVYTNIHPASLEAWDGHGVGVEGCPSSASWLGDRSYPAVTAQDVPTDDQVRTYEPFKIEADAQPFVDPTIRSARNWKDIRSSSEVSMTPLHRRKVSTSNTLVSIPRISGGLGVRFCQRHAIRPINPQYINNCYYGYNAIAYCYAKEAQQDYSHWDEQGDLDFWSLSYPIVQTSDISGSDIAKAIVETRERCATNSLVSYDLLTEVVEAPKTLALGKDVLLGASGLLKKFKSQFSASDLAIARHMTPNRLLRSSIRALRKIGSSWMTYRYGIMPLVYSFQGVRKVFKRGWLNTDRGTQVINPAPLNFSLPSGGYIRHDVTGKVIVRSTATSKFSEAQVVHLQHIGVNPLVTAWEEIPYSFVIDWFVNVGDYILAKTTADLYSSKMCCTSIRTSKIDTYTLSVPVDQSIQFQNSGDMGGPCWANPPSPPTIQNVGVKGGVVRTVTTETYDRSIFACGDAVALRFSPSINWKRSVDSFVLALNQLKRR